MPGLRIGSVGFIGSICAIIPLTAPTITNATFTTAPAPAPAISNALFTPA